MLLLSKALDRAIAQIVNRKGPKLNEARSAIERLKTEMKMLKQVVLRKAFVDTLIPGHANRAVAVVISCGCNHPELHEHKGHLCPQAYEKQTIEGFNARINSGAAWQAGIMGNAEALPCNYIALSANSLTIATGDTTLSGEISSNGLSRAQATYGSYSAPGSVGGSASYALTYTWTATGTQNVNSCASFNANSGGTMFTEINFSTTASLAAGDSLSITYTFNI